MLQVKIIFRLFYFWTSFFSSNQVNLPQPRSTCFNLDQFRAGQKNTGHRLQVTDHCLPIQKVSWTFIKANLRPKQRLLGIMSASVNSYVCFCIVKTMTCDLWPVTCDLWPVTCDLCFLPAPNWSRLKQVDQLVWNKLTKVKTNYWPGFKKNKLV